MTEIYKLPIDEGQIYKQEKINADEVKCIHFYYNCKLYILKDNSVVMYSSGKLDYTEFYYIALRCNIECHFCFNYKLFSKEIK